MSDYSFHLTGTETKTEIRSDVGVHARLNDAFLVISVADDSLVSLFINGVDWILSAELSAQNSVHTLAEGDKIIENCQISQCAEIGRKRPRRYALADLGAQSGRGPINLPKLFSRKITRESTNSLLKHFQFQNIITISQKEVHS